MEERKKTNYIREGEIHTDSKTLWVNSDKGCEVRINHLELLDGLNSVKCRIVQSEILLDITLEKDD